MCLLCSECHAAPMRRQCASCTACWQGRLAGSLFCRHAGERAQWAARLRLMSGFPAN